MVSVQEAQAQIFAKVRELEGVRDTLLGLLAELPPSHEEESKDDIDPNRDPEPAEEMRAIIGCVVHDYLEPLIRDLQSAAEYKPRPSRGLVVHLDLSRSDDATRQVLYGLVVKDNFLPQELEDPGDIWVPPYTPEEAGLEIYFQNGRWFATWLKLEEPADLPESERRELLRLEQHPKRSGRLIYNEI